MRPINLSNFSNKIISKILSNRLTDLLPKLVSENQTGFVKGGLITENILLTREIAQNINKKNKGGNVMINLDMAKAYDKVSWHLLMAVLKRMGFAEFFMDMVYRLLSNVWYSVLINGIRYGFFQSTRGL